MTRIARTVALGSDVHLALAIGPTEGDGLTLEDLRIGWRYHGDGVCAEHRSCARPWGWWQFEAGEEMPLKRDEETLRLAELGELTDAELAALRERATEAKLRVGTDRERLADGRSVDAPTVDLWEAVRALGGDYRRRAV